MDYSHTRKTPHKTSSRWRRIAKIFSSGSEAKMNPTLHCFLTQVTRKGKSVSPGKSLNKDARFRSSKKESSSAKKVVVPHDYYILRISPCPAETLKDLVSERRWMFKCRNMLLYITHRLHQLKQVLSPSCVPMWEFAHI